MGIAYNPRIVTDGLVFSLDVANRKCISPLGCTGFNNAPQLVKNLVSTSDTINSFNGVKLGNLSYYTIFSIDYPEPSFGGSAAGREGITPGYNVTSGTKTFDFGRALHYAVYNNPTQSWVKTSRYDSYVGTAAVDTFVSEYATAVATYPDAVHIVAGSHRDSYHTAAQYEILRDLGAPSNVDSIIGFSSPEWILVGKPGLGAGNAYGWVFQNYSTDPTRVAHLNMGLPIYGGTDNYLEFDGTDDYITVPDNSNLDLSGDKTLSCWVYMGANSSGCGIAGKMSSSVYGMALAYGWGGNGFQAIAWNSANNPNISKDLSRDIEKWVHITAVQNGSTRWIYAWDGIGVRSSSYSGGTHSWDNNVGFYVGCQASLSSFVPANTRISQVQIYNRALTSNEVQQNFNATRSRFGI